MGGVRLETATSWPEISRENVVYSQANMAAQGYKYVVIAREKVKVDPLHFGRQTKRETHTQIHVYTELVSSVGVALD